MIPRNYLNSSYLPVFLLGFDPSIESMCHACAAAQIGAPANRVGLTGRSCRYFHVTRCLPGLTRR
jgi:hypothetical protein